MSLSAVCVGRAFNASKQAVNPGPGFGPYGLPKAATLFLAKQYALEYGYAGIRSNAINADRVNTGMFAGGLLEERAGARGQSPLSARSASFFCYQVVRRHRLDGPKAWWGPRAPSLCEPAAQTTTL